jgi:Cu(I)/Ag(I) efflux system membrane fusion protein
MKHAATVSIVLLASVGLVSCSRGPASTQHSDASHAGPSQTAPEAGHQDHAAPEPTHEGYVAGYAPVELDPERVQAMGIRTERVAARPFTSTLRTVGIVEIDETRVAHVQTKFEGWIENLHVDFVGKPVTAGQPLFSVYSPELVAAQEEYVLALKSAEGDREGPMAAEIDRWSRSLVDAARRRLARWDIPAVEIERLERERTPRRALTINSPVSGIVLKKTAVRGMNVEPGMDMFTIADFSRVWVQADVYERDMPYVRVGQSARLSLEALPGRTLHGRVEFISPTVDETTRTVKVRLEFENRRGLLKPGMYTTAELTLDMGRGLALPEEALIDTGQQKIVFVARGGGRFEPREVQLGSKVDSFYQVLSGLAAGEEVATSAQFLLDSESRLKAAGGAGGGHAHGGETK